MMKLTMAMMIKELHHPMKALDNATCEPTKDRVLNFGPMFGG